MLCLMSPNALVRSARQSAGLTQQQLADRLQTTQSAVAQLESNRANPTVATLQRALQACGRQLLLEALPEQSSIDETLVVENLRLTVAERLHAFERGYADVRQFALDAARSRGELA